MNKTLRTELMKSMFGFKSLMVNSHHRPKAHMNDMIILDIIAFNAKNPDKNAYFSDIQEFMQISKPGVSQLLRSIEKRGLIERKIDERDKRKFVMSITDEGKKLMCSKRKHLDTLMDEIIERLGEEDTKELIRLFNRLGDVSKELKNEDKEKE
ncbi:DNA-binding MarR family transcriptional regulator [Bacilli bacterium PM5-3]|nr:DNA-binding MarR family transcriptional regulator [Bacilli bacterium PM5-3]MDH6603137.1 DNA-binding MarR family transcriptional regulator [Bacilli bacterium PM5-9]